MKIVIDTNVLSDVKLYKNIKVVSINEFIKVL